MATDYPTATRAAFDSGAKAARAGANGSVRKRPIGSVCDRTNGSVRERAGFAGVVVGSVVSIRTPTPTQTLAA